MASIRFSEFVDLLLVRLYQYDQQFPDRFVDLAQLAEQVKAQVPPTWVFDAGKVLDTRALADVIFTYGGTSAKLTGEGRLYVEEGRGVTRTVQEAPQNYFNITVNGNNSQVVAGSQTGDVTQTVSVERERAPAFQLLDEIKQGLKQDQSLPQARRDESIRYADLVREELKKDEPNRSLIGVVLESLSKVTSIAGHVASLIKMFNASLVR
jgi:hypothetical protein